VLRQSGCSLLHAWQQLAKQWGCQCSNKRYSSTAVAGPHHNVVLFITTCVTIHFVNADVLLLLYDVGFVLRLSVSSAMHRYLITCGPHLLWVAMTVLLNPDSLPPPRTPQQQVGSSATASAALGDATTAVLGCAQLPLACFNTVFNHQAIPHSIPTCGQQLLCCLLCPGLCMCDPTLTAYHHLAYPNR
jgi:hypothetical protein